MPRQVALNRDHHTVIASGPELPRVDLSIETDLYGEPDWTRSTLDSILGEKDSYVNLSWSVKIRRDKEREDEFPLLMPNVIGNVGFHAQEDDDGEGFEAVYMSHLHVQEPARRRGYGELLWDCYLAVALYGGLDLRGGIGSTENAGTVGFLLNRGVPMEDISKGRHAGGEGLTTWDAELDDVVDRRTR